MPCKQQLFSNTSLTEWKYITFRKCKSNYLEVQYAIPPNSIKQITFEEGTLINPYEPSQIGVEDGNFINIPPRRTPIPRITPTPTPSSTCECRYVSVNISQINLNQADNNELFLEYRPCSGVTGSTTISFTASGQYVGYCVKMNFEPILFYYENGIPFTPIQSTYSYAGCCSTPTPTPTPTPTHTPTKSVTPTKTPTPTPTCECFNAEINISQQDIDSASGNTHNPSANGVVYYFSKNCGQTAHTESMFTDAGTFYECKAEACGLFLIFQDDEMVETTNSTETVSSVCCTYVTPTPTPTPSITPTQHCDCYKDIILISQDDLDAASGNTFTGYNNTVFYEYVECGLTGTTISDFNLSAQYPSCHKFNEPYSFYYFQNNIIQTGVTSYRTDSTTCCNNLDCYCYEILNPTDQVLNLEVLLCGWSWSRGFNEVQPYSIQYWCLNKFFRADSELQITLISKCNTYSGCTGPNPTPTPTPTPGLSPTPTPTPGLSPTPTPTIPCQCELGNVFIYESDILSATGNTDLSLNNVLLYSQVSCGSERPIFATYTTGSTGQYFACIEDPLFVTFSYYQDDVLITNTDSYISYNQNIDCCNLTGGCNCHSVRNDTENTLSLYYHPCNSIEPAVLLNILPNSTEYFCGTLGHADVDLVITISSEICYSGSCGTSIPCKCMGSTIKIPDSIIYLATGNTNPNLNFVFYEGYDCGSSSATTYILSSSTWTHCHQDNTPYLLYFYQNDVQINASNYGIGRVDTVSCNCENITPTPTKTPTPTPTPSSYGSCRCYEITTYSGTNCTISYTDCDESTQYMDVSAGTYYLCAKVDSVLCYDKDLGPGNPCYNSTIQLVSGCSLIPDEKGDYWDCNYAPGGTPTPTPTPTETPNVCDLSGSSQWNGGNLPTPTPTSTPDPLSPFISVWRTTSTGETIYLPIYLSGNYDFIVDWGDGNIETITSYTNNSHTYTSAGDYTVTITGIIESWNFSNVSTSVLNIVEILQWGCLKLGNDDGYYFVDCSNLVLTGVTDVINLQYTTTLEGMFSFCSSITTINRLNEWDVSNVINMDRTFHTAINFDQDISGWNVSGVTIMYSMFGGTKFNQNISGWTVSNVQEMGNMFAGSSFNQPIGNWDVSNVTNMSAMFSQATDFNQDISGWNVSGVTNMSAMFNEASSFDQNIGNWDVSNVNSFSSFDAMFQNAINFDKNIGNWNVSGATSMRYMFNGASKFNQDISNWNVLNVVDMQNMFTNAVLFNQDLSGWCVSLIPSQPAFFDSGATAWTLPNSRPVWGTCP